MQATQERQLRAFKQVLAFLAANPPASPPANYAVQLKVLTDVADALMASATDQDSGLRVSRQHTREQRILREQLRLEHMQPIARIARAQLRTVPGIEKALHAPRRRVRSEALIIAANAMADATRPYAKIFVENGLLPSFITDLQATARQIDGSLDGRLGQLRRRSAATEAVRADIRRGRDAVVQLDAIVRPMYHRNAQLKAGWHAAKRLPRSALPAGIPLDVGRTQESQPQARPPVTQSQPPQSAQPHTGA
ncbi:MAG: hypothetical protein NVS1B4_15190 [Gemmatimonadaceae bacterium]